MRKSHASSSILQLRNFHLNLNEVLMEDLIRLKNLFSLGATFLFWIFDCYQLRMDSQTLTSCVESIKTEQF